MAGAWMWNGCGKWYWSASWRVLRRPRKLTPATALALLLGGGIAGGITTAARVSQLSGRGVGLEVVRQAVAALKGSLAGKTEPGKGTRIEVAVPVVVESQEVLHVQAAEILVSIPLRAIRQAMRLAPAEIAVSSEGQSILYEGQAVRYAPLLRLLKHSTNQALRRVTALVLESPSGLAALGVDHVAGPRTRGHSSAPAHSWHCCPVSAARF